MSTEKLTSTVVSSLEEIEHQATEGGLDGRDALPVAMEMFAEVRKIIAEARFGAMFLVIVPPVTNPNERIYTNVIVDTAHWDDLLEQIVAVVNSINNGFMNAGSPHKGGH